MTLVINLVIGTIPDNSSAVRNELLRVKRGGGGGGHGGGHGPGKGGGAAGPVYICGYIGGKEGMIKALVGFGIDS